MTQRTIKHNLSFTLNGEITLVEVEADDRLIDVLRDRLLLTGTKQGCGDGECGACTVLLNGIPVNSCLVPAMKAQGKSVITIEGLARGDTLHPLQESFLEAGAVQCGFCTPGMILSAKALLDHKKNPADEDIKLALSGNICRCTGYVQIIEAVKIAATKLNGS
ncbi:MAG: (2Fe-2S)-binding protein [Desulfobacterales bacterium]|nr:(2Fe-2S)-binding protein [Desulfobacterales bacterium]